MRLLAVTAIGGAVLLLWLILGPVTDWAAGPEVHRLPDREEAAAINAVRQTLLQASGGTAALSALVFTATNYLLNRRGQFTDRYTAAIAQLASEKMEERIGGIYALEHVMLESERDHSTVVEVLVSFVRENAPVREQPTGASGHGRWMHPPTGIDDAPTDTERDRPATDIQAALSVISRRPKRPEPHPLDLNRTDLRGANLRSASLAAANLQGARLAHADLTGADLDGAYLRGTRLEGACLRDARLNDTHLWRARLSDAVLGGTQLNRAFLWRAQLQHADLRDAQLNDAVLRDARLEGAHLWNAQLNGADLKGAHLTGAFLWDAQLNGADLKGAKLDHADMKGVRLADAKLAGAEVGGVRGLSPEQMAAVAEATGIV
jgi:uncharacterized protein YjbI with pentapeptide repeats